METNTNIQKEQMLKTLLQEFKTSNNLDKIITYFGDVTSKTVIIGESPTPSHYVSNSNKAFCFDIEDFDHTGRSGEVLLKVLKDLNIDKNTLLFNNLFKIPYQDVNNTNHSLHIELFNKELEIIDPDTIIILGNIAWNHFPFTNFEKKNIIRIFHPAYILRHNYKYYDDYLYKWRKALCK